MKIKSLALPLIAISSFANANIVVNGSFESTNPFGWTIHPASQGSNYSFTSDAHTGLKALKYAASAGEMDGFFQSLDLQIGQTYNVSLWIKNFGVGDDKLGFWLYDENSVDGFWMEPISTELESWNQISFQHTATGTNGQLRVQGFDPNGFIIDDVSVEAVPEPATLAALAGIAAIIKRRKNR